MEGLLLRLLISSRFINKHGQHRQYLFLLGWFLKNLLLGQAVSEEKIFRNRPIRKKNCLWWPCLLMDRDEMSNLYRGSPIYVSNQVLVYLVKRFQRRRFLEIDQSETRIPCGGHVCKWTGTKWALLNRSLVGSIYGRFSIKIAHFVPIH
jgi:hypothetical protein